jgi:hypothetical protein
MLIGRPCHISVLAQLADRPLEAGPIQAPLEIAARVAGTWDEDVLQRDALPPAFAQPDMTVEVLGRDLPALEPAAEQLRVITRRPKTEPAQRLGIRLGCGDRFTRLLLGVAGHGADRTGTSGREQAFDRELAQSWCS